MPPTVSCVIRFHDDAQRVARLVRLVRPHVDEVLCAADAGMSEEELAVVAGAADVRLVRIPYRQPLERATAYLLGQCLGDWILRLEGDEVPSTGLLEQLGALVGDRAHAAYSVPRPWLWPDRHSLLAQRPWWPDYQLRLMRNDLSLLDVTGGPHGYIRSAAPRRNLETPLYHAALIVEGRAEREAKVRRYDAVRADWTIVGRPFNEAYYFPEAYESLAVRPVADADLVLLDEVLGADGPPLPRPRAQPAPRARSPRSTRSGLCGRGARPTTGRTSRSSSPT
jgi:hypothetical protein